MSISADQMESALDAAFKEVTGRVPVAPCPGAERTWQRWTDQDNADLQTLVRLDFTANEIARALRRSRQSVQQKANDCGLYLRDGGDA